MIEISKLKKNGETIFPATVSDAVVHKETRSPITKLITNYNISDIFPKGSDYSLVEAISKLDEVLEEVQKIPGVTITFTEGGEVSRYSFEGGIFNQTESWKEVGAKKLSELEGRVKRLEDSGISLTIDSELSLTSKNPVQNKVISEQIKLIKDKLFPLSISVSGGGTFKKGLTKDITVKWTVKEGEGTTTPDSLTINDEPIEKTSTSKEYKGINTNTVWTVKATKAGVVAIGNTSAKFVNPKYYGIVEPDFIPGPETVVTLGEIISDSRYYNTTRNLNNQKLCYSYPAAFGKLTKIMDNKNVNYLKDSYTMSEFNLHGEKYYSYVLTKPTTIVDFVQTYS